jgi:feruloyl-CoA synthase
MWPAPAALQRFRESHGDQAFAALEREIAARIDAINAQNSGSSRRIARFTLLTEPPSLDAGEITDKGYINQRAVLARRAGDVQALYGKDDARVIRP